MRLHLTGLEVSQDAPVPAAELSPTIYAPRSQLELLPHFVSISERNNRCPLLRISRRTRMLIVLVLPI